MENDIKEVLFNQEQIENKVKELGKQISEDYTNKNLLLIGILKGANVFMSDLMREIDIPVEIDFLAASSYGDSTESSGVVKINKDLDTTMDNKHVLIVEDIIDTGLTLNYLLNNFKSRDAKSIEVCTLLDKPERRKVKINAKYKGFNIPDEFIVGYGIDYAERYRNLPYIATLKEKVY